MDRARCTLALLTVALVGASSARARKPQADPYQAVIQRVAGMVGDPDVDLLAKANGLAVLNVTWEDTGRYQGSSVGPNISDMTIQVHGTGPRGQVRPVSMPVIRFPNFADQTADLSPEDFHLLVGNERGQALRKVTLHEYLKDFRGFLHDPKSWKGQERSLLAPRDTKVLVSAQACFLPIPERGEARFDPVLFNYQSWQDNPAVLAILVTREGTSATVIDNTRDGFEEHGTWGQRLFFNANGQRASLTGRRKSEWLREESGWIRGADETSPQAAGQEGVNMVLLVQVPLKQRHPRPMAETEAYGGIEELAAPTAGGAIEDAVLGHGDLDGPFTEVGGLAIERDPRFPVRVTVQFYKATASARVDEFAMEALADQIERVYAESDYVGSLVTGGDTGRVTAHSGEKVEPPDWWATFWSRHMTKQGLPQDKALRALEARFGRDWPARPRQEISEFLRWETW